MAEESTEICGFLDVKFFGGKSKVHKVKKRTLGPWKVWKRHWCSVKKLGPGLGVKVQLDYLIGNGSAVSPNDKDTSIIIPLDATIYRTQSRSKQFAFVITANERKPLLYLAGHSETESQRWMANIRQLLRPRKYQFAIESYSISMVDNMHSKASGLTGLYGDLIANALGVFIKDVHSGNIVQSFEWNELGQFHLTTAGRPEDVKCICVIHTTKEFHGGVGELQVFCLEATKLLQNLVTQGRGPRNKQMSRRPFSLSEGDLRIFTQNEYFRNSMIRNEKLDYRTFNRRRESHEKYEEIHFKMHNKATEDSYQPEPFDISNSGEDLGVSNSYTDNKMISDMSMTSGIYEEIAGERDSNITSNPSFCSDQSFPTRYADEPPPLPPRQRCASESISTNRLRVSRSNFLSMTPAQSFMQNGRNAYTLQRIVDISNYVPMSPRLKDITLHFLQTESTSEESEYVLQTGTTVSAAQRIMDNSNYVPMSPRLKDITLYNLQLEASLQENEYVIMRSTV